MQRSEKALDTSVSHATSAASTNSLSCENSRTSQEACSTALWMASNHETHPHQHRPASLFPALHRQRTTMAHQLHARTHPQPKRQAKHHLRSQRQTARHQNRLHPAGGINHANRTLNHRTQKPSTHRRHALQSRLHHRHRPVLRLLCSGGAVMKQPQPKLWHPALDALTLVIVFSALLGLPDIISKGLGL